MEVCIKHFNELTREELYALLRLRAEVFVVEQQCPYLDPDGIDPSCYHVLLSIQDQLAAVSRIIPPGIAYAEYASLGRVATHGSVRRTGIGRTTVHESLRAIEQFFPAVAVKIAAQSYLEEFYRSFGFDRASEDYLFDGILHCDMVRAPDLRVQGRADV
ncbi:MAG: GNAT family N-acetyltransferase [Saprospiraceae bacterium]|nr:GNAT family N-acetyltransferase [Saprospiraceae bacterium]